MVTLTFNYASLGKFVLGLIVVVAVFFALRWVYRLLKRLLFSPKMHGLDKKGVQFRWQEIERLSTDNGEMSLKMAVLEADKLLDHALKAMAMPGKTLGERLKFAAYKYPKIKKVWWAHRLRNQLAHESSFYLDPRMARRAIREFKKALQMLNLL